MLELCVSSKKKLSLPLTYVLKQGVWQPVLAAGSDITLNEFLTSYVQMVYSCTTSHSYQI